MNRNSLNSFRVNNFIKEKKDNRKNEIIIKVSVVIVTYNNTVLLLKNLDSLKRQTVKNFEIIIVDNNDKINIYPFLKNYPLNYIRLNKNYGPSLGRNVGIKYATGDIVIFLDDDAIPAEDFVEQHIKAYQLRDIYGLRGRSLPRSPGNIYNYIIGHYNLGDKILPWYIDLEGNSSFKRYILLSIGGFNPEIKGAGGHEGIELTHRIIKQYKDKSKLIYYPEAIIYHDYTNNFSNYLKKLIRQNKYKNMLESQFKDIFDLTKEYNLDRNAIKNKSCSFFLRSRMRIIKKVGRIIVKINSRFFNTKHINER